MKFKMNRIKNYGWVFGLMLLALSPNSILAQKRVTGTVTDQSTGDLLPGVNIVVKGTTNGALTDFDGNFNIEVISESPTLIFSYVGFISQEVPLGNDTNLIVAMEPDIAALEEVVVIGYGTQNRETVTGSIATIKADEFNSGTINDPLTLISGKVAGLYTSNPTSDPNATADFSIRGPATIAGNSQPLIVIDGIPGGSMQSIAPADIESIDVLKDGSAAAIYGSRATAGVIIITTKKGREGATKINYATNMTTNLVANRYDVLNAAQYIQLSQDEGFAVDDAGYDTNWFDEVTRTPINTSHTLSLSGGSGKTNYYASINYNTFEGIDKASEREFYNGTLRVNTKALNDKLDFSFLLNNSFNERNFANYGALSQSLKMNPTYPVRNPDGSFYQRPDIPFGLQWNPVASMEHNSNNTKERTLLGTIKLDYHFLPELTGSLSYSLNKTDILGGSFSSPEDFFQQREGQNGSASRSENNTTNNIVETTVAFNKELGDHDFNVIGGFSYQNTFNEGFSAGNNNFNTDAFEYNNLGAGSALNNLTPNFNRNGVFMGSYANERTLVAFFGRMLYNFQKRYLVNLSVRREGASVLGANNKWGTFYGISGGWVLSNEPFMENAGFVKNLKLRGGYGVTGNQESLSPYQSLATLGPFFNGTQNSYFGEPGNSMWVQPYGPLINPNPLLQWETKKEVNIGMDFTFFKNGWLSGSIDYYKRKIENLVGNYSAQLPSQIYPNIFANAGLMENEGMELALDLKIFQNDKFRWNATFTGAYNKNEIVSITSEQFKGTAQNITRVSEGVSIQRLASGQPVAAFYGRVFAGFSEDGDWLFRNSEGDAVPPSEVGDADFAYLGNSIPKYNLGLTNNFKIGNFDMTILLRSALDFKAVNGKRIFHENISYLSRQNLFESALDQRVNNSPTFSSYYIEDGGYLKLDNVTLGYSLPMENIGFISNLRVFLTGSNLLTVTNFSGTDPEMGLNYYPADPNAEVSGGPSVESYYNYYPRTRNFTLGINASF
ncbi:MULTISPECIES: SusC/RagA family TonB-linked outer membrane protein [Flavobacteriaceae]|jgi:TonB-linked SusC/RagA family outer membrane protein|uniref:SusC/RagA family TonB-linked outer membrane protein n=1 Tax=Flagellimonas iocasae TaxID=2055905 RepID=A0ABW4Y1Z1_9FLAO|nr:SusC/RagA family TonB-linked outer membrane protein [Muricauda sp. CP2A]